MRIFITENEFRKYGLDIEDSNFSEIAVNYIQDNYFCGADNAIIYLAHYPHNNCFEFEIIPG